MRGRSHDPRAHRDGDVEMVEERIVSRGARDTTRRRLRRSGAAARPPREARPGRRAGLRRSPRSPTRRCRDCARSLDAATRPSIRTCPDGVLVLKTRGRYCRGGCRYGARGPGAWRPKRAGRIGAGAPVPGSGIRGRSTSSAPSPLRKRRSSRRSERRRDLLGPQPGPVGDVLRGRGAEALQVARGDEVHRRCRVHRLRAKPVVDSGVEIRGAPLPGPGRGHPHHVQPRPDPRRALAAEELGDLVTAHRAGGDPRAKTPRRGAHLGRVEVAVPGQPGALAQAAADGGEGPVVRCRDEVDGRAEQRSLGDRPPLQRPRQRSALEAGKPRPQPDVHRGRVLGLDAADPLDARG